MTKLIFSSLAAVLLSAYGVISQIGLDNIEKLSIVSVSVVAVVVVLRELKQYRDRDVDELKRLRLKDIESTEKRVSMQTTIKHLEGEIESQATIIRQQADEIKRLESK